MRRWRARSTARRSAGQADIVIAGSHPCDIEFWQAHKSLYPADIAVKEGGTIIVVTPCPEGVAVTHQEMLGITPLDSARIESMIEKGELEDVVSGGLALAWAKMRERAKISLVSDGISGSGERRARVSETVEPRRRAGWPRSNGTGRTRASR